jgi:hypothetical protein
VLQPVQYLQFSGGKQGASISSPHSFHGRPVLPKLTGPRKMIDGSNRSFPNYHHPHISRFPCLRTVEALTRSKSVDTKGCKEDAKVKKKFSNALFSKLFSAMSSYLRKHSSVKFIQDHTDNTLSPRRGLERKPRASHTSATLFCETAGSAENDAINPSFTRDVHQLNSFFGASLPN